MVSVETIKRIGFEDWAFNIVVNEIENQNIYDGFKFENDDYTMSVKLMETKSKVAVYVVAVRAYVPTVGWQSAEFNLNKK